MSFRQKITFFNTTSATNCHRFTHQHYVESSATAEIMCIPAACTSIRSAHSGGYNDLIWKLIHNSNAWWPSGFNYCPTVRVCWSVPLCLSVVSAIAVHKNCSVLHCTLVETLVQLSVTTETMTQLYPKKFRAFLRAVICNIEERQRI